MRRKKWIRLLCSSITIALLLGGCSTSNDSNKKENKSTIKKEASKESKSKDNTLEEEKSESDTPSLIEKTSKPSESKSKDNTLEEEKSESDTPNLIEKTSEPSSGGQDYEAYLNWKVENYQAASDKEKENAARAFMIYSAQKSGNDITMQDVGQVPDEILPSALEQMEQFYAQDQEGRSIRQILDDNYNAASNLNLDLDAVDLGDYEKYLNYTDQDYAAASSEDKKNVLIAYYLAVMGTDINEVDVNDLGMDFNTLDSSLQQMFQALPRKTVREILEAAIEMFQ